MSGMAVSGQKRTSNTQCSPDSFKRHIFRKSNFRKGGFGTKTHVQHKVPARLIQNTCFLEIEFSKRRFRGGNPLKSGLHRWVGGFVSAARIWSLQEIVQQVADIFLSLVRVNSKEVARVVAKDERYYRPQTFKKVARMAYVHTTPPTQNQ